MSVRLGPRDMWALQWIAEMYGVPVDIVAELLGTSETNAYRVVSRWRAAGLVSKKVVRPIPGSQWVVPTPDTVTSLLGFHADTWIPGPQHAKHLLTTARVRLALAGREIGEDDWISERVLRRSDSQRPTAFGGSKPHVHDGQWTDEQGELHCIEVELTRKGSADARAAVAAAFEAAKAVEAADLVYYCESPEVKTRVEAAAKSAIRRASSDPEFRVRPLDELLIPQAEPVKAGLFAVGGAA